MHYELQCKDSLDRSGDVRQVSSLLAYLGMRVVFSLLRETHCLHYTTNGLVSVLHFLTVQ